ncbi:TrkH family potassium uptake protein [Fodinicurvata sp. EGI_FJ10296]|uniref:TrkH family potassium uptake protein n=1 Tax=Fodinicurvata sp. EGI_FJ10296 TaxID=3231908 RepID=UPI00345166AA
MRLRPVLHLLGYLWFGLGLMMLLPIAVDLIYGGGVWDEFLMAAGVATFVGLAMTITTAGEPLRLRARQAFLVTGASWVTSGFVVAMPLIFAGVGDGPVDAIFEAFSGLTTTGATVLTNLESLPRAILFWRALLQWLGGIGVIVMAIAIFPFLGIGGMALFRTESSDKSEKVLPRTREIAVRIAGLYAFLSFTCAVVYWLGGMSGFDAITHAMTTVSTAGYSNYDASFAAFPQLSVHWIAVVFMILGALPFALYIQLMSRGDFRLVLTNPQVRSFFVFLVAIVGILTLWLMTNLEISAMEAATLAALNVTSVVTTTGYANSDYSAWGAFPFALFVLLMFVGGCTGSTAGGIKIYRHQVSGIILMAQLRRLLFPNAVVITQYDGKAITPQIVASINAFLTVAFGSILLITVALGAFGLDFVTAFSAAVTAVMNVGPGLGPEVGPASTFAGLPDGAKGLIAFAMVLGRLEFFTLLILLVPAFWRD